MIRALLFLLLFAPGWAMAGQFPAIYDVTGVAETDTLNVRSGPATDFRVIGKLAPDATGVEVVDINDDGDWGLIITGEQSGWVALRFMARQPGQPETGLPERLSCSGTEPFWSFRLAADGTAEFSRPDITVAFNSVQTVRSENRTDRHAVFGDGGDTVATAIVGRNQCSDGMSDRVYGLGIDLVVTDTDKVRVYSGCCSVAQ